MGSFQHIASTVCVGSCQQQDLCITSICRVLAASSRKHTGQLLTPGRGQRGLQGRAGRALTSPQDANSNHQRTGFIFHAQLSQSTLGLTLVLTLQCFLTPQLSSDVVHDLWKAVTREGRQL